MLMLSRKEQEAIVIQLPDGRLVRLFVVEIRRGQVQLGFVAPEDVRIERREKSDGEH